MHKFKEGNLWLLTSTFDQRLTEISVIVGILGTVSAWPIFKSIHNWWEKHQHNKSEQIVKVVTDEEFMLGF